MLKRRIHYWFKCIQGVPKKPFSANWKKCHDIFGGQFYIFSLLIGLIWKIRSFLWLIFDTVYFSIEIVKITNNCHTPVGKRKKDSRWWYNKAFYIHKNYITLLVTLWTYLPNIFAILWTLRTTIAGIIHVPNSLNCFLIAEF